MKKNEKIQFENLGEELDSVFRNQKRSDQRVRNSSLGLRNRSRKKFLSKSKEKFDIKNFEIPSIDIEQVNQQKKLEFNQQSLTEKKNRVKKKKSKNFSSSRKKNKKKSKSKKKSSKQKNLNSLRENYNRSGYLGFENITSNPERFDVYYNPEDGEYYYLEKQEKEILIENEKKKIILEKKEEIPKKGNYETRLTYSKTGSLDENEIQNHQEYFKIVDIKHKEEDDGSKYKTESEELKLLEKPFLSLKKEEKFEEVKIQDFKVPEFDKNFKDSENEDEDKSKEKYTWQKENHLLPDIKILNDTISQKSISENFLEEETTEIDYNEEILGRMLTLIWPKKIEENIFFLDEKNISEYLENELEIRKHGKIETELKEDEIKSLEIEEENNSSSTSETPEPVELQDEDIPLKITRIKTKFKPIKKKPKKNFYSNPQKFKKPKRSMLLSNNLPLIDSDTSETNSPKKESLPQILNKN